MNIDPQETINQLGGRRISSALAYCGVSEIVNGGSLLRFKVNGRRGERTYISVRLDPSDTYTVMLWTQRGAGLGNYLDERSDVYCDELQSIFESMYDNHMNARNGGFIPVGR